MVGVPSLVGLGMSTIDLLVSSEALPSWEGCAPLDDLSLDGGGMAANTLVAFSRLGGKASLIGTYGAGALGALKTHLLASAGVEIRSMVNLEEDEPAVTLVFVQTSSGERTFASTGRMRRRQLTASELDRDAILGADGLFLDGFHPQAALAAAGWMRAAGKLVFVDGGRAENAQDPVVRALADQSTIFFGGAGFCAAYNGVMDIREAGRRMLTRGPAVYVETLGENGCWIFSDRGEMYLPAFPVRAIDTTGAGDVFHGAFLLAWMAGEPLAEAGRFASAAAALKCERRGAQAACPNVGQVRRFLAEQ